MPFCDPTSFVFTAEHAELQRNKSSRFSANSAISAVKCLSVILRALYSPPSTQRRRGTSHRDFLRELGDLCGEMPFYDPRGLYSPPSTQRSQRNKEWRFSPRTRRSLRWNAFLWSSIPCPQLEFGHCP